MKFIIEAKTRELRVGENYPELAKGEKVVGQGSVEMDLRTKKVILRADPGTDPNFMYVEHIPTEWERKNLRIFYIEQVALDLHKTQFKQELYELKRTTDEESKVRRPSNS